jgi:diguanylate cyclase (GGDEF)-like protein
MRRLIAKPRRISLARIWGVAALCLAGPRCHAQPGSFGETSLGIGLCLLLLLAPAAAVLAVRWRVRGLLGQFHQLERAAQLRIADLEREREELLRESERMRHFAEHDGLTGLWNHRIILDRLRGEVDRSRRDDTPLSLVMVDLDLFKKVNDDFGHPAGDRVLIKIAAILQRSVRSYDWVGRYGGEEFLLILPGSGFSNARLRAEQLRVAVQETRVPLGGREIQVTASFGVVSGFPRDAEEMVQAADTALYRAKRNGRNCVMVTEITPKGN